MAEQDDPAVSRRQFFRGMTGNLFRALGELSGLDRMIEAPEVVNLLDGDVPVPPERQSAAMSEIFGFLEQLEVRDEPPANGEAPASPDPSPG